MDRLRRLLMAAFDGWRPSDEQKREEQRVRALEARANDVLKRRNNLALRLEVARRHR